MAWKSKYMVVILKTDLKIVVKLLRNKTSPAYYSGPLVEKCKILINRDWRVEINHADRKANKVADWMSNWL